MQENPYQTTTAAVSGIPTRPIRYAVLSALMFCVAFFVAAPALILFAAKGDATMPPRYATYDEEFMGSSVSHSSVMVWSIIGTALVGFIAIGMLYVAYRNWRRNHHASPQPN